MINLLSTSMATTKAEETKDSPQFRTEESSTMQEEGDLNHCPSFNSYSTNRLADTAARVTSEIEGLAGGDGDGDYDDDFEFVSFQKTDEHVVFNSPICPVFPIFNQDLLFDEETEINGGKHENASSIRISLEKLLIDDRDCDTPSSSSSEADELEGVPPGTYCVWCPKPQVAERGRCEKSKSTGSGSSSSKRWRFRDLLRRSNSDGGKSSLVILTPSSRSQSTKKKEEKTEKLGENAKGKKNSSESKLVAGKSTIKVSSVEKLSSAHEVFYVRNRMLKEGDRRRSYLPYKRDLVGFWANINSSTRAFPPF